MSGTSLMSVTPASLDHLPSLVVMAGDRAQWRYVEFFTVTIRNPNTRAAYARACSQFFAWCEAHGLALSAIQPVHVASWVEGMGRTLAAPTVKQQLAGDLAPPDRTSGNVCHAAAWISISA